MPVSSSLNIISELRSHAKRSIVLIDVADKFVGWCYFDHPYDIKPNRISNEQFDDTKSRVIKLGGTKSHTIEDLPVLSNLGGFKTTVITRLENGTMVYSNGETVPTDLLMGLE